MWRSSLEPASQRLHLEGEVEGGLANSVFRTNTPRPDFPKVAPVRCIEGLIAQHHHMLVLISFEDEGPMSSAWGPGDTSCLLWDGGFGKTFLGKEGPKMA